MRWVLFGANGWIGQMVHTYILHLGDTVVPITQPLHHQAPSHIQTILQTHQPDRVFIALGRAYIPSHRRPPTWKAGGITGTIDDLEVPEALELNVRDNLYLPIVIADCCRQSGIHCTYLGTGCIYEYDEEHPDGFTETDEPNYTGSSYSTMKGYTDRLMGTLFEESCLTLRIRMPITGDLHPRNFLTKMIRYQTIVSIPNSMSVLPELLPIAISLAREKQTTGRLNLTNPGVISHQEILQLMAEEWKLPIDDGYYTITTEESSIQHTLRARRSNNHLNTTRLEQLDPEVLPIQMSLRLLLKASPRPTAEQLHSLRCLARLARQEAEPSAKTPETDSGTD